MKLTKVANTAPEHLEKRALLEYFNPEMASHLGNLFTHGAAQAGVGAVGLPWLRNKATHLLGRTSAGKNISAKMRDLGFAHANEGKKVSLMAQFADKALLGGRGLKGYEESRQLALHGRGVAERYGINRDGAGFLAMKGKDGRSLLDKSDKFLRYMGQRDLVKHPDYTAFKAYARGGVNNAAESGRLTRILDGMTVDESRQHGMLRKGLYGAGAMAAAASLGGIPGLAYVGSNVTNMTPKRLKQVALNM